MTRIARWAFLPLAFLPLAACSSNDVTPTAAVTPVAPAVNPADASFATQAAASDQFEIQSSQIALQKARSPRVKQFAQRMIDAHTQTTQQLTGIATAKGMTLTPTLDDQQQTMISNLQAMRGGPAFDRAYLHDQVAGHAAAVALYQNEIATGQDADIKGFAQQTLPVVQNHLRDARRLGGR
jgi:putative membrane protein